jgi:calcineurin-like phosphoesterase
VIGDGKKVENLKKKYILVVIINKKNVGNKNGIHQKAME